MSISIEMPDWFRRALHPTLPVAIVASLWALASSQRPPQDRVYIGTWMDSPGVFVTGDPYERDINPIFPPFAEDGEADESDANQAGKPAEVPSLVGADVDEL